MSEPESTQRDYRDTVFLPKTDFPMKAGLPQKEPKILARWQEEGLYDELRDARRGREKFIIHDGPPYANGDMHIGHALNRILKDAVVRSQTLLGKDAPLYPAGIVTACPSSGRLKSSIARRRKTRRMCPRQSSGRNAATMRRNGSISSANS